MQVNVNSMFTSCQKDFFLRAHCMQVWQLCLPDKIVIKTLMLLFESYQYFFVKLILEMTTVHRQRHSFPTRERMFMGKITKISTYRSSFHENSICNSYFAYVFGSVS